MIPLAPDPPQDAAPDSAEARFLAFRDFTIRMGFAIAVVPTLLILLWLHFSSRLPPGVILPTLTGTLMLLLFPLAVWAGVRRERLPWFLYGGTAASVALSIWNMGRTPNGYALYLWVLLYPCMFTPMLSVPFTLWENAWGLVTFILAPAALRFSGLAPGFPLMPYYAMVAPAFAVTAFFKVEINKLVQKNEAYRAQIESLAHRDGLTGAYNRRFFMDEATRLLKQARRSGRPASLIMFDLDHFKKVNDTFGHGMGDRVIQEAARILQATLRETDLVARFGGEEFIALLPDTDLEAALVAAERVRVAAQGAAIAADGSDLPVRFTASLGVALAAETPETLLELMERADRGLYAAKAGGRNRVEVG